MPFIMPRSEMNRLANKRLFKTTATSVLMTTSVFISPVYAQGTEQSCVMQEYAQGNDMLTLAEIRKKCANTGVADIEIAQISESQSPALDTSAGVISKRIISEKKTEFDPYVITPHKMTYILPAITTNTIQKEAYQSLEGYEDNLENVEAKFQISLKVPLNTTSMFIDGDALYLGFTLQAWWQIYAQGISKPFRETNYQPEIFYLAPLEWHPFGGNTGFMLGMEHQSNGRGLSLSRSWNRIYTNFLYEKDRFALSFKPWFRLPEDEKQYPTDPDGDDNPDIADYMGHFELGMAYKWNDFELSFNGRRNFATNKGFNEIGFTFPLWGKLKGYATASEGYGESLIDYNHRQTRFGLGIALTNVL